MEPVARAFLSYAHADNDREGGRILRLAELIKSEFATLTGSEIEIFTDNAEILWGQNFREKLDEALAATTFFIPVLTPTYFSRPECRKELAQFATSANALGLKQLLLSLRYVPVPDLREDSKDELKKIAAQMQYEHWDQLRLLDESSAQHRQAIHRLAERLVTLTDALESSGDPAADPGGSLSAGAASTQPRQPVEDTPTASLNATPQPGAGETAHESGDPPDMSMSAPAKEDVPDDEEDGLLDRIGDIEPAMQSFLATLKQFVPASEGFNSKLGASTQRMEAANSRPNAIAAKLTIARELREDIEPELKQLEELSADYTTGLLRLDPALRAMIDITEGSAEGRNQIELPLKNLVAAARTAMASTEGAADAARRNAHLSRDLRPVLRRYETAMRNIVDGFTIMEGWESALASSTRLDLV